MNEQRYLCRFFKVLALLVVLAVVVTLPYSYWWVTKSGDVDLEGVVARQARGEFALFGSGMVQNFPEYKVALYKDVKPSVIALGSSRVMQFRGRHFTQPYLNIGGTAGNLAILRSTAEALLAVHKPKVIILGLDFWWFTSKWEAAPHKPVPLTMNAYATTFDILKTPYEWLFTGKISLAEFFAPLTGAFAAHKYGIMAQRFADGFGSDGSWNYTADLTGQQKPFDYQYQDTLKQVRYGIKGFAWSDQIGEAHVEALAELVCKLKSRGIEVYTFIAPVAPTVLAAMKDREGHYPQLFKLQAALEARGVNVLDFGDPATLGSSDCEFVDGFHGGDVTYARILQRMGRAYPELAPVLNVPLLDEEVATYAGHAMLPDARVTGLPEVDFMHLGCPKIAPK